MLIFASAGKQESDAEPTEDNVIQSILYRQIPLDGKFIHRFPLVSLFSGIWRKTENASKSMGRWEREYTWMG